MKNNWSCDYWSKPANDVDEEDTIRRKESLGSRGFLEKQKNIKITFLNFIYLYKYLLEMKS